MAYPIYNNQGVRPFMECTVAYSIYNNQGVRPFMECTVAYPIYNNQGVRPFIYGVALWHIQFTTVSLNGLSKRNNE